MKLGGPGGPSVKERTRDTCVACGRSNGQPRTSQRLDDGHLEWLCTDFTECMSFCRKVGIYCAV